jgi:hypothetical protein
VTALRAHTPVLLRGFWDAQTVLLGDMVRDELQAMGVVMPVVWFYSPMAFPLLVSVPANMYCFPSAVDVAHYVPQRTTGAEDEVVFEAEHLQRAISKPRLGFFGVIDERMDLARIEALARAEPNWQIIMVGPVVKIDPRSLPQQTNIHWLGQQPYAALSALVHGWHVYLVPFALNAATRSISPTKRLEYRAAEKPVLSTAVRDVVDLHGQQVRIAHWTIEFIQQCRDALQKDTA